VALTTFLTAIGTCIQHQARRYTIKITRCFEKPSLFGVFWLSNAQSLLASAHVATQTNVARQGIASGYAEHTVDGCTVGNKWVA
jgi:hypothetical protein